MTATALAFAGLAAPVFAVAAYVGTHVADMLCAKCAPFDDGPAPVAFRRAPFALAGALLGFALAAQGEAFPQLAISALLVLALAGCTAADLRCGILPDVLTLGSLALVVGLGAAAHDLSPAFGAAVVMVPFALAAAATRGRAMGWGDVKLAGLGGALLGARDATLAFMLAALAAYAIARRTGGVRRPIAFGPYLAASIAVMLPIVRII
jgi:prepilin signal peptidase PulO-like enzyme (type II secretory pathway)